MTTNPFDAAADTWDSNADRVRLMRTIGQAMLRDAQPPPDAVALDYGCGTGLVGLFLLDHVAAVTGADKSPGMLRVLRAKIAQAGIRTMGTVALDLERDPVPPDRYDLITVGMTLHHIADIGRVLRAFHQMLRPAGQLCIADLDTEPGTFHGSAGPAEGVHHYGFDRQAMCERLKHIGFTAVRALTAAEFRKPVGEGREEDFSIFLIVARR